MPTLHRVMFCEEYLDMWDRKQKNDVENYKLRASVILKQILKHLDKKAKEDEMDGVCSMNSGDEKCIQHFGWQTWEWLFVWLHRYLKDNIEVDVRKQVVGNVRYVSVRQDRDKCQAVLRRVTNSPFPKIRKFLTAKQVLLSYL